MKHLSSAQGKTGLVRKIVVVFLSRMIKIPSVFIIKLRTIFYDNG